MFIIYSYLCGYEGNELDSLRLNLIHHISKIEDEEVLEKTEQTTQKPAHSLRWPAFLLSTTAYFPVLIWKSIFR